MPSIIVCPYVLYCFFDLVRFAAGGDHEFLEAFRRIFIPIALEWKPEFIIISCGLDAAKGDPLGGFNVR